MFRERITNHDHLKYRILQALKTVSCLYSTSPPVAMGNVNPVMTSVKLASALVDFFKHDLNFGCVGSHFFGTNFTEVREYVVRTYVYRNSKVPRTCRVVTLESLGRWGLKEEN